jgi:hypothetical protein
MNGLPFGEWKIVDGRISSQSDSDRHTLKDRAELSALIELSDEHVNDMKLFEIQE